MNIHWKRLIPVVAFAALIVFFNAYAEKCFQDKVDEINTQTELSLKSMDVPTPELSDIQLTVYKIRHESSVKANLLSNFYLFLLCVSVPFFLFSKKTKKQ